MSVLIKGIEMPKEGHILSLVLKPNGKVNGGNFGEVLGKAVKVPTPHGRLIDADLLFDTMLLKNGNRFAKMFKADWLDIMPTILEADREEL